MFCKNCGASLPDDTKFCANCGTPVSAPEENEAAAPAQEPAYNAPPQEPIYNAQPVYTQNPQPQFFDCGIQQRDIATAIILSIVTCGIYGIYWFIKLVDDVNKAANDQNAYSGGITFLLNLVTCGIYGIYWYYQAGKKMNYAKQARSMPVTDNAEILYLVIALVAPIVNMCLIQSDLNRMATPK